MTTTQYVGARYVPLFKGEWDNTQTYEPLCIVSNQGNSYTSMQYVPMGIAIDNEEYWALTGNYNAQIEEYRKAVNDISTELFTIENKFNYVTPEEYGAIGDGIINDTEAFNKALKTNKILYLTKSYNVNEIDISTSSELIIIGNGNASVYAKENSSRVFKNSFFNHNNVVLYGINFIGVDNEQSAPVPLVAIFNSNKAAVINCSFSTNYGDGIRLEGCKNATIRNCNFNNIGLYSDTNASRNGVVIYNHYFDNKQVNVSLSNVEINNCYFNNIADECCRIDGAVNVVFTNNICKNIGQDIIETAHGTDTNNVTYLISNVQVENLSRSLLSFSADSENNMPYNIDVYVNNVHIDGLNWVNTISKVARPPKTYLIPGYTTGKPINVSINNSSFNGKAIDSYESNHYFILGNNVIINNTSINMLGSTQTNNSIIEGDNISIISSKIAYAPANDKTHFVRAANSCYAINTHFECINEIKAPMIRGKNLNIDGCTIVSNSAAVYFDQSDYCYFTKNIVNFKTDVNNAVYTSTSPNSLIITDNCFTGTKASNMSNNSGAILSLIKDNA